MAVSTKTIDRGWDKIKRELSTLKNSYTKVGLQKGEMHSSGQLVAQIAAQNEYGTRYIPSRPFMRTAFSNNLNQLENRLQVSLNSIYEGRSSAAASLNSVGVWYTGKIQETITNFSSPPNAPSTIAQKGSSNVLIDTGQLRQSVKNEEVIR